MHIGFMPPLACALVLPVGCAVAFSQEGFEQRTAQAIGRSVSQFAITTDRSEETGGRVNYIANTRDGVPHRCCLVAASGFVQAVSSGQGTFSEAIFISRKRGESGSGSGNQAPTVTGQGGRSAHGESQCVAAGSGAMPNHRPRSKVA